VDLLQVNSAAQLRMQTQLNTRSTRTLEELLGAFQYLKTAEKPIQRSQSELALAAVLHASKVVASRSPQSTLSSVNRCEVRSSSLPIGIPTYGSLQVPQPAVSSASVPSYPAQSGSDAVQDGRSPGRATSDKELPVQGAHEHGRAVLHSCEVELATAHLETYTYDDLLCQVIINII